MVYKTNFIIFCLFFISLYAISQNTFIPDDNFEQALIDLGYDVGPLDDFVPTANINSETELYISSENIADLTGIEDFTALSILDCSENQLTNIDVTQNTSLTQLFVQNNQITNIDLSVLLNLQILWCYTNQLTNIDVTQNTDLISLRCENNQLTSLNTSNNPNLNVLLCEQNQIINLDLTSNTTLNRFQCGSNLLSNLDVSNNPNLVYLFFDQNNITNIDLTNNSLLSELICFDNELTALDLTQNSSLTLLNCSNNQLCNLNINNGNNNNITFISFDLNPDLNCVVVDNPLGDHTFWLPISFSNYVNTFNECSNLIPVDSLNDVIGTSYTLPILINGSYFTQSEGNGVSLNTGDIITTSQTIYIYNEINCNSNESNFNVLINDSDYFIPKYFTPNNDSSHDFWQVLDNTNSIKFINIFDKYGKLLKSLQPNSQGWNGLFNGKLMPTDDYWYVIMLDSGETLRGHFTLKR